MSDTAIFLDYDDASMQAMPAQLRMPYTLTTGRATGTFLVELANHRLVGTRCNKCATTRVPAQDYCPACGGEDQERVVVPPTGDLVAWTQTAQGLLGLIQLDGTDVPLLHRLLVDASGLSVGDRLQASWADETNGTMNDLAGFTAAEGTERGEVREVDDLIEPTEQLPYTMTLSYQHAYGHFYGSLFDGIKSERRIRGVRCPQCRNVLVPPREYCDLCYVPTSDWVDVADTGVVQGCSVVHIEFLGQRVPPPYVYAEIVLDGSATRLIHTVGGLSAEEARAGVVKPGSRVRAKWSDRRTGSLVDIEYFEVIDRPEQ